MAAPTSYTEATLKAYLNTALGAVAGVLGWTVDAGDYDEIVNETLLVYDVTDIANATEIRKLRTLGRRELWRAVMTELATDYDYEVRGDSAKRSQAYAHAKAQFELADADARLYDAAGYRVESDTVTYGWTVDGTAYKDPYEALEEDDDE